MVWVAVALSILQAMREAGEQDKADTVPTPFLYMYKQIIKMLSLGAGSTYKYSADEKKL